MRSISRHPWTLPFLTERSSPTCVTVTSTAYGSFAASSTLPATKRCPSASGVPATIDARACYNARRDRPVARRHSQIAPRSATSRP